MLRRALSNRSASLLRLGRLQECIADCHNAVCRLDGALRMSPVPDVMGVADPFAMRQKLLLRKCVALCQNGAFDDSTAALLRLQECHGLNLTAEQRATVDELAELVSAHRTSLEAYQSGEFISEHCHAAPTAQTT